MRFDHEIACYVIYVRVEVAVAAKKSKKFKWPRRAIAIENSMLNAICKAFNYCCIFSLLFTAVSNAAWEEFSHYRHCREKFKEGDFLTRLRILS